MGLDDKNRPLYMISIAAELAGVHPQTLRSYEQKGLVTPRRTSGNTRMYSQADIDRLNLINELTSEGINLAGVTRILDLQSRLDEARGRSGRPARAGAPPRRSRSRIGNPHPRRAPSSA